MKKDVVYGKLEVGLSRVYPFGEVRKKGKEEVSFLKVNELNGYDQEAIESETKKGKNHVFVTISVSTGITYDEALMLADKDSLKLLEEIQGF